MILEDLVKIVDEPILRQYTKIANWWEGKGRSKYVLAFFGDCAASLTVLDSMIYQPASKMPIYMFTALAFYNLFHNETGHQTGEHNKGYEETGSGKIVVTNPTIYTIEKALGIARAPLLGVGVYFTGMAIWKAYTGLKMRDSSLLGEAMHDLYRGVPALGVASSIYIRNTDPKLLEKKPLMAAETVTA